MSVLILGFIPFFNIVVFMMLIVVFMATYSSVELVRAYEQRAYTVLGEYRGLLDPGLNFIPPFVSRTYIFDKRTQTIDIPRQEAITEDNSPVTADAVVYIKVMDAKKAFLEVDNYKRATSQLAQTTLRAVLGDMALDDTLNKRQQINSRIQKELHEPTDEWGIRVESVEVKEVNPSSDVQSAMEEQTSAERKRRAMILEAQGERRSAVEEAEGMKRSNIIRAQGEKQSQILEAQGEAISTVLKARAAQSMGEQAIIEKGMETLAEIGEGKSTKFIIPQELTSMVGRYGKHLTGSDVKSSSSGIKSQEFDEDTKKLLGLNDIEEIIGQLDEDMSIDTSKEEVKDPEEVVEDPDNVVENPEEVVEEVGSEENN